MSDQANLLNTYQNLSLKPDEAETGAATGGSGSELRADDSDDVMEIVGTSGPSLPASHATPEAVMQTDECGNVMDSRATQHLDSSSRCSDVENASVRGVWNPLNSPRHLVGNHYRSGVALPDAGSFGCFSYGEGHSFRETVYISSDESETSQDTQMEDVPL